MPNLKADLDTLSVYVKRLGNKDYLMVGGRVFAAHDARQFVGLETELIETPTHYRFRATVRVLNNHLPGYEEFPDQYKFSIFTGTAQSPIKGGASAEKTNPLEVAETSAVGRALGFAGFGDLTSIASAEEVESAISRSGGGSDDKDPNAPTAGQKIAVYELAKRKITTITNPAKFGEYVQQEMGKPASELTVDDVKLLSAQLKKLPNPTEEAESAESAGEADEGGF